MTSIKTLSIVIPCYNEERTVHLILDKVIQVKLTGEIAKELILVNDCSTDRTREALESYVANHPSVKFNLLNHEINQGKEQRFIPASAMPLAIW